MSYQTYGDPYSDPPRPRICVECGCLIGDEAIHSQLGGCAGLDDNGGSDE